MKVLKFGGRSLATLHKNTALLQIIEKYAHLSPLIIVVSAIENTTNLLLNLLKKAKKQKPYHKELKELKELNFYSKIDNEVNFQLIENILQGVSLIQDYSPKVQDLVLAQGELISSKIVAELLNQSGTKALFVDSSKLIKTDSFFTAANVNDCLTENHIQRELQKTSQSRIIITGGFIGSTTEGEITTLGRNGSNLTAALFANYANAEELLNFTHVDGIYTANPEWVSTAKTIDELHYDDASELANFGANILHTKTIIPLIEKKIPLRILNTLNPNNKGTLISAKSTAKDVKSLSVLQDVALIQFFGKGLLGKIGVDARIFNALAKEQISVSVISQGSSERGIGFVVDEHKAIFAKNILETEFAEDLYTKDVEQILVNTNIAVISIIGQDLESFHKPYSALIKNKIVPILFNNSITGKNVSLVVEREQFKKALHVIHGQIFGINKKINVVIVGHGTVGSALINQMVASRKQIAHKKLIDINIFAIANSKTVSFSIDGFSEDWKTTIENAKTGSISSIIEYAKAQHLENLILVDNTASELLPNQYETFINEGFDVVSSNKIGNTLSFEFYKNLRQVLKNNQKEYLYETNVGAGLPLIDNIKLLHLSGENITRIKGVFSGTLSFIFNTFSGENKSFSAVLKAAISNGFTEPDPRDDLSGTDVARKLLILARELDLENELDDIRIQNLIPDAFQTLAVVDFLNQLNELNPYYNEIKNDLKPNEVLRYVGELSGDLHKSKGVLETKLIKVDKHSALGQLSGSDSIFEIYTESYGDRPIIIQGAGAGAHVTARGVFGDILRLAEKK